MARRPQDGPRLPTNLPTARAKSTYTKKLQELFVEQAEQAAPQLGLQASLQSKEPGRSNPSRKTSKATRPLIRRIDRPVIRGLAHTIEDAGSKPKKPWKTGSRQVRPEEARSNQTEDGERGDIVESFATAPQEGRTADQEGQEGGQFTVRRVAAALPSNADTNIDRARLTVEKVTESAKVSGKTLARLTEQLKLITALGGRDLQTLTRWRQGAKMQGQRRTSAPPLDKQSSLVRTVKLKGPGRERPGLTTRQAPSPATESQSQIASQGSPHGLSSVMRSISVSPPSRSLPANQPIDALSIFGRPGFATRQSLPPTPRERELQNRIASHRSPYGLSFTMRSVPLSLSPPSPSTDTLPILNPIPQPIPITFVTYDSPTPTSSLPPKPLKSSLLGLFHGRMRQIIRRVQRLAIEVGGVTPKETALPLRIVRFEALRELGVRRVLTEAVRRSRARRRGGRVGRVGRGDGEARVVRQMIGNSRRRTMRRSGGRRRVRKHPSVKYKTRRGWKGPRRLVKVSRVREVKKGLEDEVGEWLGGG